MYNERVACPDAARGHPCWISRRREPRRCGHHAAPEQRHPCGPGGRDGDGDGYCGEASSRRTEPTGLQRAAKPMMTCIGADHLRRPRIVRSSHRRGYVHSSPSPRPGRIARRGGGGKGGVAIAQRRRRRPCRRRRGVDAYRPRGCPGIRPVEVVGIRRVCPARSEGQPRVLR